MCRQVAEGKNHKRKVHTVGATEMLEIVAKEPVSVQVDATSDDLASFCLLSSAQLGSSETPSLNSRRLAFLKKKKNKRLEPRQRKKEKERKRESKRERERKRKKERKKKRKEERKRQ